MGSKEGPDWATGRVYSLCAVRRTGLGGESPPIERQRSAHDVASFAEQEATNVLKRKQRIFGAGSRKVERIEPR